MVKLLDRGWHASQLLLFALLAPLLLTGCTGIRLINLAGERVEREPPPPSPGKYSFRVSQFHFVSDFEINKNLPIFKDLANLREQVCKELALQGSTTPIQVHLFENREKYEQFMQAKYPYLPKRRAFFVAQPRLAGTEELLVYTFWGERVQQDLRHELTHALLHSVLKDVPLWLDEGLAEYFEVPAGQQGVNYQHLAQMLHTPPKFQPDLMRLERLTEVSQMNPPEYRESWAWVHLMLHGSPESRKVLVSYLRELRSNARPAALQPRLTAVFPAPEEALVRHLGQLDAKMQQSAKTPRSGL